MYNPVGSRNITKLKLLTGFLNVIVHLPAEIAL